MAKLTIKARDMMPKSQFGEPAKRAFPMPNKAHAVNAKARATQAVDAGRMSKSTAGKIDAKANKIIGKPAVKPKSIPVRVKPK